MNDKYYNIVQDKYAALIKSWYTQKWSWKMLHLLSWLFLLAGVTAIVGMTVMALQPPVPAGDAVWTMILGGVAMACPLFCFAYVTKTQAVRCVGKPYTAMRNPFLYSNRSGIQFGYHDCYDFKRANSMIVHQIAYANIHHVEMDRAQSLFTVVGRTERVEYEDVTTGRIAYEFTSGQFGDMASFSFFLALENEQEFFDDLKSYGVEIKYV